MNMPGTMTWFAAHEMRLAWRDVFAMLTGGKAERLRKVAVGVGIFLAIMHAVAYFAVGRLATMALDHDLPTLIAVSVGVILAGSAVLSQAMAKQAIDRGLGGSLADGLLVEQELFTASFRTEDSRIGVQSFLADGPGKAQFVGR